MIWNFQGLLMRCQDNVWLFRKKYQKFWTSRKYEIFTLTSWEGHWPLALTFGNHSKKLHWLIGCTALQNFDSRTIRKINIAALLNPYDTQWPVAGKSKFKIWHVSKIEFHVVSKFHHHKCVKSGLKPSKMKKFKMAQVVRRYPFFVELGSARNALLSILIRFSPNFRCSRTNTDL